jgi:carboxylesterase type B
MLIIIKLSIIFLFFTQIKCWEDKSELTVEISDGKILGRYMTSRTGRHVRAFLGIPYAQPPIGDLRFRAPKKIEPWTDVKTTQVDSPLCVQINPFARDFKTVIGQEDCLFLNVYTPVRRNITAKFPVIYWIHGGVR